MSPQCASNPMQPKIPVCHTYLSKVDGQVDFIVFHASGQRGRLPPLLRSVDGVLRWVVSGRVRGIAHVADLQRRIEHYYAGQKLYKLFIRAIRDQPDDRSEESEYSFCSSAIQCVISFMFQTAAAVTASARKKYCPLSPSTSFNHI